MVRPMNMIYITQELGGMARVVPQHHKKKKKDYVIALHFHLYS
jgi:hypothetical protein